MVAQVVDLSSGGLSSAPRVVAATANATARRGDFIVCDASGGTFTVTLPTASIVGTVGVTVTAGTSVSVARAGADTIDGGTSLTVVAGQIVHLASDGSTAWVSFERSGGLGGAAVSRVNTVAASGAAQTIPEPGLYGMNDITLTANCTLTLPAATAGKELTIVFRQDATGSRTLTWPANTKGPGGTIPVPTATASAIDLYKAVSVVNGVWDVYRPAAALS